MRKIGIIKKTNDQMYIDDQPYEKIKELLVLTGKVQGQVNLELVTLFKEPDPDNDYYKFLLALKQLLDDLINAIDIREVDET